MGFTSKRSTLRSSFIDANRQIPMVFLAVITMAAIGIFVQLDRMKPDSSRDIRAKAFQQTATGIRIEAEEMTLNGSASKDPTGTFIRF